MAILCAVVIKCYFNNKPECNDYYCLSYVRQDKQDIHFEKVED